MCVGGLAAKGLRWENSASEISFHGVCLLGRGVRKREDPIEGRMCEGKCVCGIVLLDA